MAYELKMNITFGKLLAWLRGKNIIFVLPSNKRRERRKHKKNKPNEKHEAYTPPVTLYEMKLMSYDAKLKSETKKTFVI